MAVGVEYPNVVDLITHDERADEYALIMIESREWSDSPEQLDQLLNKANHYAIVATEGLLARTYPQSAGRPVRIQLDCVQPPSTTVANLLAQLSDQLRTHSIRLVVNVLD